MKNIIKLLISFTLLLTSFFLSINAQSTLFESAIKKLCDNYKREFTILEICDHNPYISINSANLYNNTTFVLLPAHGARELYDQVIASGSSNIVILEPEIIDASILDILGRCESPDIVTIHNFTALNNQPESYYRLLLSLGDFVCIESSKSVIQHITRIASPAKVINISVTNQNQAFCIIETGKKGLDIARWNQICKPRLDIPRYKIISNFNSKRLYKKECPDGSDYIRGVNLLTCVMLNCLYPTDKIIRDNIKQYKKLDHEDLVIGNFVVQGSKILPIDFNDIRRRGSSKKCVEAALDFFKNDKRFNDIYAELKKYEMRIRKD